tara:strand:- start:12239 stop:12361 length:123 start_codon:yes stop_codon:yes gene_type:complete
MACERRLVVLLQHRRTDEAFDGWLVRENTDDIGAALDIFV